MWKCPKCGRAFASTGQHHFCGKAPETVDDYILSQDESVREQLQRVRAVLRKALPDAAEKMAWSMPTYWQGHNIIHFAAQKKHIGLYPGPEAVAWFAEKLEQAGCEYSKGSVRIPYGGGSPPSPDRRDCGLVPGNGPSRMKRYEYDAILHETPVRFSVRPAFFCVLFLPVARGP